MKHIDFASFLFHGLRRFGHRVVVGDVYLQNLAASETLILKLFDSSVSFR
jgi:hypothetical protein